MIQYLFNTGTTLNVVALPQWANLNTEQIAVQEVRILVDTSVARTIILPYSALLPATRNIQITVVDITGAASANNITVQASAGSPDDTINGTSTSVINQNFQANRYEFVSTNEWAIINASAGGGGGTPLSVSMTYSQLISAIGGSALITGQRILLTDYQTSSYIQFSGTGGGGIGNEEIHLGGVEPLLLTAISSNEISMVAESISNSQDTILYKPVVADGDYEYAASSGKGCIVFRRDNTLGVSRDYDFRNVVFRRWETSIGNGKFWSYEPVAGAAHQDYNAWGGFTAISTTVNSPLSVHTALGYPYWLDNTLFLAGAGVVWTSISEAFANTFVGFDNTSSIAGNTFNVCSYNLIVSKLVVYNNINLIARVNIIGQSTSDKFQFNGIAFMSVVTANSVNHNNLAEMERCVVASCDYNSGGSFKDNNSPSASMSFNSGFVMFSNNTCANGIQNNIVANITKNSCDSIVNNQGYQITENTTSGSIQKNNCNVISNNSNTGNISSNIVDEISQNGATVTNIAGNIATSISLNSNAGEILNNNFCGGITGNSGTCNFDGNAGTYFTSNELSGDIKFNNSINITSSSITAGILDTNFVGSINAKTINPTANMIAGSSAFVVFDYGLSEFVEQVVSSGAIDFSGAITA